MSTQAPVMSMRKAYKLTTPPTRTGSVRLMRHISYLEGERLVEQGKAMRILDRKSDAVIGFQMVSFSSCRPEVRKTLMRVGERHIVPVGGGESCRVLSKAEAEAASGLRGRSQTAGLSEDARVARIRRNLLGEDFVECAQAKLAAFAPRLMA